MKKLAIHGNLISKFVTFVVACFCMVIGFCGFINSTKPNSSASAVVTHTLTIIVDERVVDGFVNNEELIFTEFENQDNTEQYIKRYANKEIIEDTEVSMLFGFDEDFVFDCYFAYQSENIEQIFDGIVANGFFMPHYDLTIEVQVKRKSYIVTVNKILYDTKTIVQDNPLTEEFIVEPETDFEYVIPNINNYHLFNVNGNCFDGDIDNLILEEKIIDEKNQKVIIAECIINDGIVNIYYERDYFTFNIYYGADDSASNNKGGNVTLNANDYVFIETDELNKKINNIYFNCDIDLHVVVQNGYRFDSINVFDEAGVVSGYLEFTELDKFNNFLVKEVYSNLNIYVRFIKTYDLSTYINSVSIDGRLTKIAQIAYEFESFDNLDLFRTVDINSYITYQTRLLQDYSKKYEFKKWNITNKNGTEISAEKLQELNIIQNYNKDTKIYTLRISNVVADLKIMAIYGIKEFSFNINWNTLNGKITADIDGEDDFYKIEFGNSITLTLTPNDEMRFLKSYELLGQNEFVTENIFESVPLSDDDDEKASKFRISNVTENLTFKVEFVTNTWWEHLEISELVGRGTSTEPYLISNAMDLALMSYFVNNKIVEKDECIHYAEAYYKLTNSIDCEHLYYSVPTGTLRSQFNGIFDYNYCSITNIWTERDASNFKYDGIFDVMGPRGRVINKSRSYIEYALYVMASLAVFALIVYFVMLAEKIRKKPKKVVYLDGQEEVISETTQEKMANKKSKIKNSNTKSKVLSKDDILSMAVKSSNKKQIKQEKPKS